MSSRLSVCPVQVGREAEVRALEGVLGEVRASGHGRLLLIAGEAGVGKSRLAAEARRLAAEAGMSRLEGQCTQGAGVAFAPFVTAVRRRTRVLGADDLATLFGGQAALSAALLPEVADAVGVPGTSGSPEDLYAAVWQLLHRLAGPEGGILLLEDLHWADPDALHLLTYLARELDDLPLWVVGTYRSDELHRRHPLTATLAELGRERRYDEVALEPLDRVQVRAMLSAIFDGTEVGEEFGDLVLGRTQGNPFFVEELAKVLVERGDIFHRDGDWVRRDVGEIQLPLSVRETLLTRARSMEPESVRLLEIAAVAAGDLDLPVIAEAAGVTRERVDDLVREGLQLQLLVEERDGATTGYAFRHALSREAFADELVGPDRRRVHHLLAEAMVRVHSDDLDAVAAGLADHFAAAGDEDVAFDYNVRAARAAASASATDEADHRYDQALHLLAADDDRRLALLLEAAGDSDLAAIPRIRVAFAQEARALAAARGDRTAEAKALYVLERDRWLAGDGRGATALLEEARTLLHGQDDYEEAWVLRRLTRVLMLEDQLDRADELLTEAIELAQRSGNLPALSGMYGTRMMIQPYGPAFRELYAAAVDTARMAHDRRSEGNVSVNVGYIALWCGDFAESRRALERGMELAERLAPGDRYPHAGLAWLLALQGELDQAEAIAQPMRHAATAPTRVVALTALAEVAQRRGRADAGAIVDELWDLATAMGETQRSVPAMAARARQLLVDHGVDAALDQFWTALGTSDITLRRGSHWPFAPDFAAALAAEGRLEEITRWVAGVERMSELDPNGHNIVARTLCQAHLLALQGDEDAARSAFEQAAEGYRLMPCPAREAEALLGLAELDWRTGTTEAGVGAANAALVVARRIGSPPLVAQAELALERSRSVAVLASVLFTDIVGSTGLAASLGDQGWRELIERHHAIVRRELARTRGREVDTAGDGFLMAFDTPAVAIRCACAIRDALAVAGIEIRAGLHTGECQESGGKLTGLAVHIASRVSQAAAGGEVLVSGTVKDLVAGSDIAFGDRGTQQLRGVPGEWRLYAVDGLG